MSCNLKKKSWAIVCLIFQRLCDDNQWVGTPSRYLKSFVNSPFSSFLPFFFLFFSPFSFLSLSPGALIAPGPLDIVHHATQSLGLRHWKGWYLALCNHIIYVKGRPIILDRQCLVNHHNQPCSAASWCQCNFAQIPDHPIVVHN